MSLGNAACVLEDESPNCGQVTQRTDTAGWEDARHSRCSQAGRLVAARAHRPAPGVLASPVAAVPCG
jgi:hypothetical protein